MKLTTLGFIAVQYLGVPYLWGGDSPKGFDCSGFVQYVLQAVGQDPKHDQTSQDLYDKIIRQYEWKSGLREDSILFFGESTSQITHTAIALNNDLMIEAGGGDRTCKSIKRAIEMNAFVRIRPIINREDLVAALIPQYKEKLNEQRYHFDRFRCSIGAI